MSEINLTEDEIDEAIEFLEYSNKVAYAEWKEKLLNFLYDLKKNET